MVTAAAPALPDSHALPPSSSGTIPGSSRAASFQSVYQSLPAVSGSSDSAAGQLTAGKEHGSKKESKAGNDNLPANVYVASAIDSPSQRPWIPAPAFSLTARTSSTDPHSGPANFSESANDRASSDLAQAPAKPQLIASLRSSVLQAEQQQAATPQQPALQQQAASLSAPARTEAASSSASLLETAVSKTQARQPAAEGGAAPNPQNPIATPAQFLGAPAAPQVFSQVALNNERPGLRQPARESSQSPTPGGSTVSGLDQSLVSKEVAATLPTRSENLAFALRLQGTDSSAHHQTGTTPSAATQSQPGEQTKSDLRVPAPAPSHSATPNATAPRTTAAASAPAEAAAPTAATSATVNPAWSTAPATQPMDLRQEVQVRTTQEPANPSTVAALHEAQPVLPETAKPNTTGEILLQLGSKDQAAAIRVTDRAGAVNVSVHAADAELRSSLRSNLGELASQLSHQGWKTDVLKSGTILTRAETSQQDSGGNGQRSFNHQQSSTQGERQQQSQRDRRASSGQWLAELEEQASGNSGNPGGTN